MMIRRAFLPLISLILVSCAPIIKPLEPTATPTPIQATPTPSPAPSATQAPAHVTAYQSLHVRVRPGEQEKVIGYLYHGDTVELTNKCSDGWAQIKFKNQTGWVNARYLSDNSCVE